MNARQIVYKSPLLTSIVRCVYHNIIEGFINGFYLYLAKYLVCVRAQEYKSLRELGFSEIKPYKMKTWRRGNELDHAYRRYYSAIYDGQKSFVKIAENDKTIQNEIDVAERIRDLNWDFTPKVLLTNRAFIRERKLLAVSFEDGLHPIPYSASLEDLKNICKEFLSIHRRLVECGLVHADIHEANIMLNSKNKLLIFDFGISKFLAYSNDVDYVARPGTYYQATRVGRIYDDAYSFLCIIRKCSCYSRIQDCPEYLWVKERVGLAQFEIII